MQSKNPKKLVLAFDEGLQCFEVLGKGGSSFLGDGKSGVGFASDETFFTGDVSQILQVTRVAGKVAVGQLQQRFECGEIQRLVDHQRRHDAQSRFAFKSLVYIF